MSPTLYFSFATSLSPSQEVVEECSNVLYAMQKTQVVSIKPRLRQYFYSKLNTLRTRLEHD